MGPPWIDSVFFMPDSNVILNRSAIQRVLSRIAHEIVEQNEDSQQIALVGIQRGGVHLAARLHQLLQNICGNTVPLGTVDVTLHRDDLHKQPAPEVHPTDIPFDLNGKTVVLVDDVLCSGRTTRAALDSLNDFGRPRRIQLAVLIDRGHRELPIKADFVGKNVPTSPKNRVTVQLRETGAEDIVYLETTHDGMEPKTPA